MKMLSLMLLFCFQFSEAAPKPFNIGEKWSCLVDGLASSSNSMGIPNFSYKRMPTEKDLEVCVKFDSKEEAVEVKAKELSQADNGVKDSECLSISYHFEPQKVSCKKKKGTCAVERFAGVDAPKKVTEEARRLKLLFFKCQNLPFTKSEECLELAKRSYGSVGCKDLKGSCELNPFNDKIWLCKIQSSNCRVEADPRAWCGEEDWGLPCPGGFDLTSSQDQFGTNDLKDLPTVAVSVCVQGADNKKVKKGSAGAPPAK